MQRGATARYQRIEGALMSYLDNPLPATAWTAAMLCTASLAASAHEYYVLQQIIAEEIAIVPGLAQIGVVNSWIGAPYALGLFAFAFVTFWGMFGLFARAYEASGRQLPIWAGFGAGWFLIPGANLFMPYLALRRAFDAGVAESPTLNSASRPAFGAWQLLWSPAWALVLVVLFQCSLACDIELTQMRQMPQRLWVETLALARDILMIPAAIALAQVSSQFDAVLSARELERSEELDKAMGYDL